MSALDDKIIRFKNDVEIAHQIIHGDETTVVSTEGGPVDSFAKVIAENRLKLNEALTTAGGVIARRYDFTPALIIHVQHDLATTNFYETIRDVNGNRLHANVKILDLNSFQIEFTEPEEGHVLVTFMTSV